MNNPAQPWWYIPTVVVFGIAFYWGLGWVVLKLYRLYVGVTNLVVAYALEEGPTIFSAPYPGTVFVRFHTYSGVLAFVRQVEHRFWAPPDDAREVLRRLHRLNLGWGRFAAGAIYIPFVSWANDFLQRRSIARQEAELRPSRVRSSEPHMRDN